MDSELTEGGERAGFAAGAVGGWSEGEGGGKDLREKGLQVGHEVLSDVVDVSDGGFPEFQRRVVVVSTGMLNEEQTGRNGELSAPALLACYRRDARIENKGVEDGLEVVVAMIFDVFGIEDGGDVLDGL